MELTSWADHNLYEQAEDAIDGTATDHPAKRPCIYIHIEPETQVTSRFQGLNLSVCKHEEDTWQSNKVTAYIYIGLKSDISHELNLCFCKQEEDAMDGSAADDAAPASAVRERYERMFREKQRGSKGRSQPGDPATAALVAQGQAVRTAFQGSISSVFTKHLRCGNL